jgi:hypothetical protein
MAPLKFVKDPPVFGTSCKNFNHWKRCMENYLRLLELWEVVDQGYTPVFEADAKTLTADSKENRIKNDNAVNTILSTINETIALTLSNSYSAHEMWNALILRYEGNEHMKKTRKVGLATKLENLKFEENESFESLYFRLVSLKNEFVEVGSDINDEDFTGKLLRMVAKRPSWVPVVSSIETMQAKGLIFQPEEIFAQLTSFEENHKEDKEVMNHKSIALQAQQQMALPAQNFTSNYQFESNDEIYSKLHQETIKNAELLEKLVKNSINFERRVNEERISQGKRVVCLGCNREGHSIQNCFGIFPTKRKDGGGRDYRPKNNKYNRKKKAFPAWSRDSQSSSEEVNLGGGKDK